MTSRPGIINRFLVQTTALLLFTGSMIAARTQGTNNEPRPTNQAKILLTAVDKDGRFISTLRVEDLRLLQDGAPQDIDNFQRIAGRILSLAILIDASASQERTLPGQKLAATYFVDSIMRSDGDEAAIGTFTGTLTVEQKLTHDVTLLRQAIERAKFVPPSGYAGGGVVIGPPPPVSRTSAALAGTTAIWDAVIAACDDVLSQSSGQRRRAIILLTDGEDTASESKMASAVERAIKDDVVIYAVGIGDRDFSGVNKDGLGKLPERTGGRAFFPKKVSDLTAVFGQIGQELRTQYLISYRPASRAGRPGKIKVEIVNPDLRKADVQLFYPQILPRK